MKVYMTPQPTSYHGEESGIRRVVENYNRFGPQFGIEYVDNAEAADVLAIHAGGAEFMPPDAPLVAHCHGLYWSADYPASPWEIRANKDVINSLRRADAITVPSAWVAETIARDMRVMPHVLPHGIDWHLWQHDEPSAGFVLWNKNRGSDVCSPEPVNRLAREFKNILFWSTFIEKNPTPNIEFLNMADERKPRIVPHDQMRLLIQRCAVYLSTTKETFGIGTLEAMAAGKPVLGWNNGGNTDLIQHGVNGYLATPGDYDDLFEGMEFCLQHAEQLGENGRELAKRWTWEAAVERLAGIYEDVLRPERDAVGVVITRYQQPFEVVKRGIDSLAVQSRPVDRLVVVNDGGPDFEPIAGYCLELDIPIIDKENGGVASARNLGIEALNTKYIACLDADDWWEPDYLKHTADALDNNPFAGIAYTGLTQHNPDGTKELSHWPPPQDYDRQCNYERRYNQVLSGALFRREAWKRVGGYRGRYCPTGAGSEDAAFWTAIGAIGYEAAKVTDNGLFNYSTGGHTSSAEYREVDWLAWYPRSRDREHPFASIARPINHFSHLVRQYDEPVISVIIPVGPGHGRYVIDALDSLEAQHYRKWEVIVVDDTLDAENRDWARRIEAAFPYVRWERTAGGEGAGFARNLGAMAARGRFLFFLDADDYLNPLEPNTFNEMIRAWGDTQSAVYTDYLGVSYVEDVTKLAEDLQGRILARNPKNGETMIQHMTTPYDCAKAVRQPEASTDAANLYLWCNISTLIPTSWHHEIGGFDEDMVTWEDVDYWYRMARAGKCFTRLEMPSLVYRFHTGRRRDISHRQDGQGRHNWRTMVEYMLGKYEEIETMPCSRGCGGKRARKKTTMPVLEAHVSTDFEDANFVKAEYTGSRGKHHVNGAPHFDTPPTAMNYGTRGGRYYIKYGYLGGGAKFRVHRKDIASMPDKFRVIDDRPPVELPQATRPAVTAPKAIHIPEPPKVTPQPAPDTRPLKPSGFNLELLPVQPHTRNLLQANGLSTPEAIAAAGVQGLEQLGINPTRARAVMGAIGKYIEAHKVTPVEDLKGVTARILKGLQERDIETVEELVATFGRSGTVSDDEAVANLTKVNGIGKKTAEKLWQAAIEV